MKLQIPDRWEIMRKSKSLKILDECRSLDYTSNVPIETINDYRSLGGLSQYDASFWQSNSVCMITGMLCSLIAFTSDASFALVMMMGIAGFVISKIGERDG